MSQPGVVLLFFVVAFPLRIILCVYTEFHHYISSLTPHQNQTDLGWLSCSEFLQRDSADEAFFPV